MNPRSQAAPGWTRVVGVRRIPSVLMAVMRK
jgi:hypothetical protein